MRPIDADELKKAIELLCEDERTNMTAIAYFALRELLDTMPTIEAETDKGWISVDDRLPEIKEHYRSELVMCYSPDGEHECLFDYYEVNGFGQGCFTAEKYFGITITHWRTLPEPPKGE